MNLTPLLTDNITEILTIIIEFTQERQKILAQNLINIHLPGFIPKELEVDEFSNMLNNALDQYIQYQRLVFSDTETIKFEASSIFKVIPINDLIAEELLDSDRDAYIELQIEKLWENSLNQRVAAELLKLRR